jgi:NADH-quinone oxidoreductase subunit M
MLALDDLHLIRGALDRWRCLPKARLQSLARWFALAVALSSDSPLPSSASSPGTQGTVAVDDMLWVPAMGIHYTLAADGISRVLVLLTGLAAVAGVLFSWNIEAPHQ